MIAHLESNKVSKIYQYLCLLLFLLTLGITNYGWSEQQDATEQDPVKVALLAEQESMQPGVPFAVALHIKIEEPWHVYWKNPGECGIPLSVTWSLPKGFVAGPLQWPKPQRLLSSCGSTALGYEKELVLFSEIIPPDNISLNSANDLVATLEWLACSDATCLPGTTEAKIMLPASDHTPKPNSKWQAEISPTKTKLPQQAWNITAQQNEHDITLFIATSDLSSIDIMKADFFPELNDLVDYKAEPQLTKVENQSGQYQLKLKKITPTVENPVTSLKGVLQLEGTNRGNIFSNAIDINVLVQKSGDRRQEIGEDRRQESDHKEIAMNEIKEKAEGGRQKAENEEKAEGERQKAENIISNDDISIDLSMALLFAFLGGLILNLMPCVLPVVSLKILNFVQMSGQSRSVTFKHGILFSLGVVISFWVLAIIILIFKYYGNTVGWGFQLQEPIFVGILAAVFVIFGLSMFGVFETGTSLATWAGGKSHQKSTGYVGSFFNGVLATTVATPCTGPFLGAALGVAASTTPFFSLLIFTAVGLGMASPYLILAGFPTLMKYMPKPGNWMVTFKEMMGFLMLATTLWLLWVFGAQTNHFAVMVLLAGCLALSVGAWIFGKWGSPLNTPPLRYIGIAIACIFFAIGGYIVLQAPSLQGNQANTPDVAEKSDWEPYNAERLAELQRQGTPVLVDFTAKWCLICQANHLVFFLPDVKRTLNEKGVVKMLADWTKNDPAITEELHRFGRNGVPLYLLYGNDPNQPPAILPQILTSDAVIDALQSVNPPQKPAS